MELGGKTMKNFSCPRWVQLPSLPLYMDQVILVLRDAVGPFAKEKEKVLTAAMVNNYVKQGLIPAPEKKRYTNYHLARLIMLSVLKKALPMNEIAEIFKCVEGFFGKEEGYDIFCEKLEEMLANAFGERQAQHKKSENEAEILLNAALKALEGHLLVQYILENKTKTQN